MIKRIVIRTNKPIARVLFRASKKSAAPTPVKKKRKAYNRFRNEWMRAHGYTVMDLINSISSFARKTQALDSNAQGILTPELLREWENDCGFDGTVWPCYDEWLIDEGADAPYDNEEYWKRPMDSEDVEAAKKMYDGDVIGIVDVPAVIFALEDVSARDQKVVQCLVKDKAVAEKLAEEVMYSVLGLSNKDGYLRMRVRCIVTKTEEELYDEYLVECRDSFCITCPIRGNCPDCPILKTLKAETGKKKGVAV